MRFLFKVGMLALALAAIPIVAQAGPLEGAAIGLGTGALVAGPPGAVVGAVVGGPGRYWRPRGCGVSAAPPLLDQPRRLPPLHMALSVLSK
jgi:hypothetical protein